MAKRYRTSYRRQSRREQVEKRHKCEARSYAERRATIGRPSPARDMPSPAAMEMIANRLLPVSAGANVAFGSVRIHENDLTDFLLHMGDAYLEEMERRNEEALPESVAFPCGMSMPDKAWIYHHRGVTEQNWNCIEDDAWIILPSGIQAQKSGVVYMELFGVERTEQTRPPTAAESVEAFNKGLDSFTLSPRRPSFL